MALNPFIEYKLNLIGDKVSDFPKKPALKVDINKNNVSLTCYPGNKNSEGRTESIRAGMDAITFYSVLAGLRKAIDAEPGFRLGFKCMTPRKRREGETGMPKALGATVLVGKDQQGHVYISVVRKDPPHVKFIFRPSEWHEIANAQNEPMPLQEVSQIYAAGWADLMQEMVANALNDDVYNYKDDPKYQDRNGGGNNNYGGGNRNGGGSYGNNNGGGGQQSNNSNDNWDDIPI